jgi:hypothetical protein
VLLLDQPAHYFSNYVALYSPVTDVYQTLLYLLLRYVCSLASLGSLNDNINIDLKERRLEVPE